ncbi:MAG: rubredoxin-like domain-containing protein [Bacillota bacterium]
MNGRWKCRNCGHIHESSEAPEICLFGDIYLHYPS